MQFVSNRQYLTKRLMDIVGGIVGSVITLVLTIVLGPMIYIKSPGPIFFAQERVGKNGKMFKMYKFRTMYLDAEERKKALMEQNRVSDGLMFKMEDDPRIIGSHFDANGKYVPGIGNLIRKLSLDEFPQFSMCCSVTCLLLGQDRLQWMNMRNTSCIIRQDYPQSLELQECGRYLEGATSRILRMS